MTIDSKHSAKAESEYADKLFREGICRLRALTLRGDEQRLPGNLTELTADELCASSAGIVFGERRAGSGAFARWWLRSLSAEVAIIVRAQDLTVECSSAITPTERDALRPAIEDFVTGEDVAAAHGRFKKTLRETFGRQIERSPGGDSEARTVWLFLRQLAELSDPDRLRRRLSLLRGDVESGEPLRVWVSTSWLDPVADRLQDSGLVSASHAYRMPSLDSAAIQEAAAGRGLDARVADEICDVTGGQPLLVQRLVDALPRGEPAPLPTPDDVQQAARELRASPPQVVSLWQEQLRILVTRLRNLQPILDAYVQGHSVVLDGSERAHLVPAERHLFIAGWVGPNRQESRWGLRSPLHRVWARQVLHQLRSGRS